MADLKPAYLIHGDDHGAIAERRSGLRRLAEADSDSSVEPLEGDAASPEQVALALAAMTLAIGRRVILVDGVERWREADVEKHLVPAMKEMPPQTTLGLFAREEARASAPAALHRAVKAAGGQVLAQSAVKPWELARWTREQGGRLGLSLDAAAAKALVDHVGERQQRLLRELEKLAIEGGTGEEPAAAGTGDAPAAEHAVTGTGVAPGAKHAVTGTGVAPGAKHAGAGSGAAPQPRTVTIAEIESRAAQSNEFRAFELADALLAGNLRAATRSYLRLREQGERLPGLTYLMAQRLREALAVSARLRAGASAGDVRRGLRMPARAAERFVADVERSDPERLSRALSELAALELDSRGGAALASARTAMSGLEEDTLALRALEAMAA